ncbi:MAG TPA: hypothetical protein VEH49_03045 [Methylomirabilota bacterium]|nr:hypothetical protein [Methylomirabilota bacterium]
MKRSAWSLLVSAVLAAALLPGCGPMTQTQARSHHRAAAPAPCSTPVAPIRNNNLIVVINYNYSYNAKDPTAGRGWHKGDIIAHLNDLGRSDGNSFAESNGQAVNFYFNYTLNNDGQEHFTGSIELSGWGQGHIATLYSGQYPYASSAQLTSDLTDKAYAYIHGGWHDSRPNCPQY